MVTMAALPERHLELDRLGASVRRLDPATRALLDLSIRRRVRDDAMAPILRTDPFHLAWRRARALEAIARDVGDGDCVPLAEVRAALPELPADVWAVRPLLTPASGAGEPGRPDVRADEPAKPGLALVARDEPGGLVPVAASGSDTALAPAGERRRVALVGARLDEIAATSPPFRAALRDLLRATAGLVIRVVLRRGRVTAA